MSSPVAQTASPMRGTKRPRNDAPDAGVSSPKRQAKGVPAPAAVTPPPPVVDDSTVAPPAPPAGVPGTPGRASEAGKAAAAAPLDAMDGLLEGEVSPEELLSREFEEPIPQAAGAAWCVQVRREDLKWCLAALRVMECSEPLTVRSVKAGTSSSAYLRCESLDGAGVCMVHTTMQCRARLPQEVGRSDGAGYLRISPETRDFYSFVSDASFDGKFVTLFDGEEDAVHVVMHGNSGMTSMSFKQMEQSGEELDLTMSTNMRLSVPKSAMQMVLGHAHENLCVRVLTSGTPGSKGQRATFLLSGVTTNKGIIMRSFPIYLMGQQVGGGAPDEKHASWRIMAGDIQPTGSIVQESDTAGMSVLFRANFSVNCMNKVVRCAGKAEQLEFRIMVDPAAEQMPLHVVLLRQSGTAVCTSEVFVPQVTGV